MALCLVSLSFFSAATRRFIHPSQIRNSRPEKWRDKLKAPSVNPSHVWRWLASSHAILWDAISANRSFRKSSRWNWIFTRRRKKARYHIRMIYYSPPFLLYEIWYYDARLCHSLHASNIDWISLSRFGVSKLNRPVRREYFRISVRRVTIYIFTYNLLKNIYLLLVLIGKTSAWNLGNLGRVSVEVIFFVINSFQCLKDAH